MCHANNKMTSMIDAPAIIDRMKRELGVGYDKDLAAELGITGSAIGKWRERGSVPLEIVLDVASKRDLSLDYLINGDTQERLPAFGTHLRPRGASAVEAEVLAVAMERAAQEWAAGHPGHDLRVFDLAGRTARLYTDYLDRFGGVRELAGELFRAMATVIRPHLRWRLVKDQGGNSDEGGN
jgi:hypothetical protein